MERSEFMLLLVKNTTNGASFSLGKRYNFGSGRPTKAKRSEFMVLLVKNTTNGTSFSLGKRFNFGSGKPTKAKKFIPASASVRINMPVMERFELKRTRHVYVAIS